MKTKKLTTIILSMLALSVCSVFSQSVSTLVPGPSTFDDCLTLDQSGNIYASRYVGSTITKITPAGLTSIFATGISQANGSAFDSKGNLYVPSNISNGWIAKVSATGIVDTVIRGISFPTAVLFENDTTMLISSYQSNRIYRAFTSGSYSILYSGNGMNGPVGMVYDTNGDLIIANYTDGKIFRVNSSGQFTMIADIPGIVGFIAFGNNSIYATGFQTNKIYRIKMNGEYSVFAGSGAAGQVNGPAMTATFNAPNGIAVSKTGDTIFVSDFNARSLRVISGVSVGINQINAEIPVDFEFMQNYPNPFNPSTTFEFKIPLSGKVSLKIYNSSGMQISNLINEDLEAGSYKINLDASEYSAGVYFARMIFGDIAVSRKILLVK